MEKETERERKPEGKEGVYMWRRVLLNPLNEALSLLQWKKA